MSACIIAYGEGLLPTLMKVKEALLIDSEEDNKSLLHQFQAMDYVFRFNLTLIGYEDANNKPGDPSIVINDNEIPFQYDGRKVFISLRKPKCQELDTMTSVILASPIECRPDKESILKNYEGRRLQNIVPRC